MTLNGVVLGANQVDARGPVPPISRGRGLDRRLLCEGGGPSTS
jgi:hypothetical protein